jgi:excisionase family DNA binding protein
MIPARGSRILLPLMKQILKTEVEGAPEALLTRRELAKLCKVSTRTVDNWVSTGKLPLLRIGKRCVRFSLPDVLKTLRNEQEGFSG